MAEIKLTYLGTHGKPPRRTDMGFSKAYLVRNSMFNALGLGLSAGFAFAALFILLCLLQVSGATIDLKCLESVVPCFSCTNPFYSLWAFISMFLYGFVFGGLIGLIYNSLILTNVTETDTYDAFA